MDVIYNELINDNEDYDLVDKDKNIKNEKRFDFRKIKFSKIEAIHIPQVLTKYLMK